MRELVLVCTMLQIASVGPVSAEWVVLWDETVAVDDAALITSARAFERSAVDPPGGASVAFPTANLAKGYRPIVFLTLRDPQCETERVLEIVSRDRRQIFKGAIADDGLLFQVPYEPYFTDLASGQDLTLRIYDGCGKVVEYGLPSENFSETVDEIQRIGTFH